MTRTANFTPIQAATKRCWKCETTKPVAEFSKDKSRQDGFQPICKVCAKIAHQEYLARHPDGMKKSWAKWYADPENAKAHNRATVARARERAVLLIEKFKNAPCMDCGGRFASCAMDFDHRPGVEKCFQLNHGTLGRRTLESIVAEIAKCDLVCANCHRVRTNTRGQCGQRGKLGG